MNAEESRYPPLDGSVTALPGLVDFQAKHNPHHPWVAFPSTYPRNQSTYITYLEFCKATHRVAHHVHANDAMSAGQVVALVVRCDIVVYLAYMLGLIRAGYMVCNLLRPVEPLDDSKLELAFPDVRGQLACRYLSLTSEDGLPTYNLGWRDKQADCRGVSTGC